MERFGQTLEFYQMINKSKFSFKTVHQIGIQLITLLEQFHQIGYVYNDLKPDNICVGTYNNSNELHTLKLIDFGLSSPYLQIDARTGMPGTLHIKKEYKCF